MQVGFGAGAGVEGEPGHHQEIREARREGGRIAQRGAAVFAREQRARR